MKPMRFGLAFLGLGVAAWLALGQPVNAATEEDIEDAITDGLMWLAGDPENPSDTGQQNENGSWGPYDQVAHTCLALIKLQDRAYELGYDSPFDADYPYSDSVMRGWRYVFDDDNILVEDGGLVFVTPDRWHPVYTTGICLMALASSGTPDRENEGDLDLLPPEGPDTYKEMAQGAVNWLAAAQNASGTYEGGWAYDKGQGWADNSNSGYAVLGLAAAENFGCTVPQAVKDHLTSWIDYIQNDVSGGSGYGVPSDWVNVLKTGNLIFEMTFVGDDPETSARFEDALSYIEDNWLVPGNNYWRDEPNSEGWGYNANPAKYQAMFSLMKGFEFSGIDLIDTDADNVRDDDWFNQEPPADPAQDLATVLVGQQNIDGSWPECAWGNQVTCTLWALLTLEKISPVHEIPVAFDIKPTSCRNPLNLGKKGVTPAAILGAEDFDVATVDPSTVALTYGEETSDALLRWNLEDVAAPYDGEIGDPPNPYACTTEGPDGYVDLTLKFETQEVIEDLMLDMHDDGDVVVIGVTGNLLEEFGGTPIVGQDVIVILKKGKK